MPYRLYLDTSVFGALFDHLDAILSWNFRDMVNIRKKSIVHTVNAKYGYRLIDIISPLEVPRE